MNTIIKDWIIVSIKDTDKLVGRVLWDIVVDDISCRFFKDDYVCSSEIVNVHSYNQLIKTSDGSLYQIIGYGHRTEIKCEEFELLRHGLTLAKLRNFVTHQIVKFTDV
ncbi:MAG: hypothetical protein WBC60_02555 [Cognaticolwellia sp.]